MTIEVTTKKLLQVWNKPAVRLNRIEKTAHCYSSLVPVRSAVEVRPRCSWIADHARLDFVGRWQPRKTQVRVPARTTERSRNGQLQLTMPGFDRRCDTVEVARPAYRVSVHRASRTSRKKENRPRPGKSELEPVPRQNHLLPTEKRAVE